MATTGKAIFAFLMIVQLARITTKKTVNATIAQTTV